MSYKTDCPQCGGHNLYVTPENGLSYCFNCTYTHKDNAVGHVTYQIDTPIEEITGFYTSVAKYYHSCLTSDATMYLNSRGFDDATIQALQLGYVPNERYNSRYTDKVIFDSGLYTNNGAVLGGRISFPYIVDKVVTDIRGRTLDKHEEVRYKSPLGSAHLRGAIFPYNYKDMKDDHIVTEGEIKAGIASQFGFSCVALPGITSWRTILASSTAKQIIIFDSTKKANVREHTFRAVAQTAKSLYNPYVAMLPFGKEDKMDIDTFLLTRGPEEFRIIVTNALPYQEWAKLQRREYVH